MMIRQKVAITLYRIKQGPYDYATTNSRREQCRHILHGSCECHDVLGENQCRRIFIVSSCIWSGGVQVGPVASAEESVNVHRFNEPSKSRFMLFGIS